MGAETYNPVLLRFLLYIIMPINLVIIVVMYILIHREMMKLFSTTNIDMGTKALVQMIFQKHDGDKVKRIGAMKIREARTTMLLLITVALAFITFIPGTAIGYVMTYDPSLIAVKPLLICYLLLSVNSLFNPFIYAFNIRNVRGAAYRLWVRLVYCKYAEIEGDISSTSATAESSQARMTKQDVSI